jgi:hypothetical protein
MTLILPRTNGRGLDIERDWKRPLEEADEFNIKSNRDGQINGKLTAELLDKGGAAYNAAVFDSLSTAITALGADDAVLILPAGLTRTLTANLTIPANVTLDARMGIIETGAFTLTVNGPFSAGNYQVFDTSGGGAVVFAVGVIENHINARWLGAIADDATDNTDVFDQLLAISASTRIPVLVPAGTYRLRGLDFVGRGQAKLMGAPQREFGRTELKTIGSANITVDTLTVFVRVNDQASGGTAVRAVSLSNLTILEDSGSTRDRGVLATNVPQFEMDNVMIQGFERSLRVAYLWNARIDNVHLYDFRTSGFSLSEGNANYTNVNGLEIVSMHVSSDETPDVNLDLRGANSVTFLNLTSEGTCVSHFLVSSQCRSINIHGIHTEGGTNIIEVAGEGSPTQPFCDFSIFGGGIFLGASLGAAARFVLYSGTASNVGLASLNMHGLAIQKSASFPVTYLSLAKVANLNTTATFEPHADAAVDVMTWREVGVSITRAYPRSQIGHTGLISSGSKNRDGYYTGELGARCVTLHNSTAAQMNAGRAIAVIESHMLTKEHLLEVDVEAKVNTAGLTDQNFFARWIMHISSDGTLIVPSPIYTNDLYALDTTFAYASGTGVLTATNTSGVGTAWTVRVRITPFV